MKKYLNFIMLMSILLSFNSIADEQEDLNKYQFEYDSIMSKDHLSSKDQMRVNELQEKIDYLKKSNPDLTKNKSSESDEIIDSISQTKDFDVINSSMAEDENRNNLGINDNLKNFSSDDLKVKDDNPLTRDQEDSCGAILCLASSKKPSECTSYLKRYFSIKVYKHGSLNWNKTVNARKNFLKICPMDDEKGKDQNLDTLVNDILPSQRGNCTADELNAMTDKSRGLIRTIAKLPQYCEMLAKHSYTDIQLPSYSCDARYYTNEDWNRGYYLEKTDRKTYKEWINSGNKGHTERSKDNDRITYYKHLKVEKKCWFDKNSK